MPVFTIILPNLRNILVHQLDTEWHIITDHAPRKRSLGTREDIQETVGNDARIVCLLKNFKDHAFLKWNTQTSPRIVARIWKCARWNSVETIGGIPGMAFSARLSLGEAKSSRQAPSLSIRENWLCRVPRETTRSQSFSERTVGEEYGRGGDTFRTAPNTINIRSFRCDNTIGRLTVLCVKTFIPNVFLCKKLKDW